ncbi:MAG: N-acetylmuramate alpha-1-phosphate uridylyltransferase MurU [Pseudomonadota bacterium]
MKALILAAGYGERLRPLTLRTPKPLLQVGDVSLIERHITNLVSAGVHTIVVNVSWLGDQIAEFLGDGSRWNASIRLSREGDTPLETGGGMRHALPLLGPEPFLVVNGDVVCDFPFQTLTGLHPTDCHLVLVDNPEHNPGGDFGLSDQRLTNERHWTYAGIGVFHPCMVSGASKPAAFSVVPAIRSAADAGRATGEHFPGRWLDIGTEGRLEHARKVFSQDAPCTP